MYKEAGRLRKSGDLAGASRAYGQAHDVLRASNFDHSNVLDSLLESVSLALQANGVKPDVPLLCGAQKRVTDYAAAAAAHKAPAGPEVVDLIEQVDAALERSKGFCHLPAEAPAVPAPAPSETSTQAIQAGTSDSPPATDTPEEAKAQPEGPVPPDSSPPPVPHHRLSPLQIAGYSSLGVAGAGAVLLLVGVGVGLKKERDGGDYGPTQYGYASWLQENVIRGGGRANQVAIAGATIASVAAITAVALLVTARQKTRNSARVQLAPLRVSF
ncbi:hypothetical protein OV203_10655 [Nannocystis sp. ILAH1]|uniref:hypothetical protein n=1 Tax=Nannocystis sp. ILAH1 TaxID=2996789 RepID=UPI00226E58E1|nr:hypothetical protein [Nannocystis sp. ILAH1]MCY0987586.1 hypothetical protein [Nannocystis sp. ILAH1]